MGTRKETTFYHCRLILETETEPGTKSRFHYLCLSGTPSLMTGTRPLAAYTSTTILKIMQRKPGTDVQKQSKKVVLTLQQKNVLKTLQKLYPFKSYNYRFCIISNYLSFLIYNSTCTKDILIKYIVFMSGDLTGLCLYIHYPKSSNLCARYCKHVKFRTGNVARTCQLTNI